MSVTLMCPQCGATAVIRSVPIPPCAKCQSILPEQLCAAAETALAVERPARPLGIRVITGCFFIIGALLSMSIMLAPFNAMKYTINDEVVTGQEFLRRSGVTSGAIAVAAIVGAVALLREALWGRWAILGFCLVILTTVMGVGWAGLGLLGVFIMGLLCLAPACAVAWYLTGKRTVVAYYQALERAAKGRPPV